MHDRSAIGTRPVVLVAAGAMPPTASLEVAVEEARSGRRRLVVLVHPAATPFGTAACCFVPCFVPEPLDAPEEVLRRILLRIPSDVPVTTVCLPHGGRRKLRAVLRSFGHEPTLRAPGVCGRMLRANGR